MNEVLMKRMAKAGAALFLLSLLAVAGVAWAVPALPCTEANEGQEVRDSSRIWECSGGSWIAIGTCNSRGCIYY
jgi:hypothetical protein